MRGRYRLMALEDTAEVNVWKRTQQEVGGNCTTSFILDTLILFTKYY
jgi:hypothetical protein